MAPEEMLDVITPQGVYTGETLPKSVVHQHGLLHSCVHGVITDGRGRVAVQFRGPKVNLMRNVWDLMTVAGHISAYTGDPAQRDLLQQGMLTLGREAEEEIGLTLPMDEFLTEHCRMVGITRTDQPTEDGWMDRTLSLNFLLTIPGADPSTFKLEEGKVLAAEWRDIEDVERWLHHGEGDSYAVREPDHFELMQGFIDAVRRNIN